jgi:hypothetical protein
MSTDKDTAKRKLTPAQLRVMAILALLADENTFRWPNKVWDGHPKSDWPRQTMDALVRRGLVERKGKRMGAGITSRYYCLTEAGRRVLSHHV